jgi:aminopeptidase N
MVGPGMGVSRSLATERAARVHDVRYQIDFRLLPHMDTVSGKERLTFQLTPSGLASDLPLDFREGEIESASLNGKVILTTLVDGHLMLKANALRAGENVLELAYRARVAKAGAALTRYEDKSNGDEYIYSLFVPMDASMAFPCFDQPDLKARFTLQVKAPAAWTVIGNTAGERSATGAGVDAEATWNFPETKPISTYLFAFAAGPWVKFAGKPGEPTVYVRRSQEKRAAPEMPQLQSITARGMVWLADYFQQPFPFPKYELVLIPGFPFGGMEHAGATFLNEDGVLFRTAPTASDRFRRNILTLHELTHQWFGDLVTMRWFDDLWLKEGFAQYMAYRCLDALEPQSQAWKHFYEDIKPLAYGIDETEGTTPIFQDIPNLKDAKSAYGAIVYEKAPAILRQLEFRLGPDDFRQGLRMYLKQHAYGNARWDDLIEAFHAASGQDVREWANAWVLRRGMPEVTASWSCDDTGKMVELKLHQRDVLPDGLVWPIANEVRLEPGGETMQARWSTASYSVPEAVGKACPAYVFANAGDYAYGRFLLDAKSEPAVRKALVAGESKDKGGSMSPLMRSMLWGALWENVRVAEASPRSYVALVLQNLPTEQDETLARIQGNHGVTALHQYFTGESRMPMVAAMEKIATDRMLHADTVGLRIVSFRTLTAVAETEAGRGTLKALLAGKVVIPGVTLRQLDRWNLIEALIADGDPQAGALYAAEMKSDHTGDALKFAFATRAATPSAAVKREYFAEYTMAPSDPKAKPEDWLTESLWPFNAWNQTELTESYVRAAMDQLPEIKRDRKIFYLGVWLGAFLGDQVSAEAEAVVKEWLAKPGMDPDLRRKVLENADELKRAVRIRKRFPDGGPA